MHSSRPPHGLVHAVERDRPPPPRGRRRHQVEIEIDEALRGARWSVILLHERRVALRRGVRADSGGSIELRRSVPDFDGVDALVVRASGPRRETCRVSATL